MGTELGRPCGWVGMRWCCGGVDVFRSIKLFQTGLASGTPRVVNHFVEMESSDLYLSYTIAQDKILLTCPQIIGKRFEFL